MVGNKRHFDKSELPIRKKQVWESKIRIRKMFYYVNEKIVVQKRTRDEDWKSLKDIK